MGFTEAHEAPQLFYLLWPLLDILMGRTSEVRTFSETSDNTHGGRILGLMEGNSKQIRWYGVGVYGCLRFIGSDANCL